jgi:hypothetical protein
MHTKGGGRGSCTPPKDFEKLDNKNAIKHENRGPPHSSKYPSQQNLKISVHLC